MKGKILLLTALTLALAAGVFFANSSAQAQQPWNVVATVCHASTKVYYNLAHNAAGQNAQQRGFFLGKSGKLKLWENLRQMQLPQEAIFEYILPGFGSLVQQFERYCVQKQDASVTFDAQGFSYTEGIDGVETDQEKLFCLLLQSCGNHIVVQLPQIFHKAIEAKQLKQQTLFKASFTTNFQSSSENRSHNIQLAAQKLNGVTVQAGERFSFNKIVGMRTLQNGFKQAKVISDGVYTDGIGGGVCQVSTTLYNALLLSEIVPFACQHTLVPSYVEAGFDAMVSDSGADLTFVNNTDFPLYIAAQTKDKQLTFTIFGAPNKGTVLRQSEVEITPFDTVFVVDRQKFPELVYQDQTKVVSGGSNGVKAKAYLCYCANGTCRKVLLRTNTYKKVDMVVARGYQKRQAN